MRLPTGIALFQVTLPHRRLIFVSHELTRPKARIARDAAALLGSRGHAVVILTVRDLERRRKTV